MYKNVPNTNLVLPDYPDNNTQKICISIQNNKNYPVSSLKTNITQKK